MRLFSIEQNYMLPALYGHGGAVRCVDFSPDNSHLVSGAVDGSIIVWNVETQTDVKTLVGHETDVWTLAVSPDGEDIASGSADSGSSVRRRVNCPTLVLWSLRDDLKRLYGDVLAVWRPWTTQLAGRGLNCGHHMAEEAPDELAAELLRFLS